MEPETNKEADSTSNPNINMSPDSSTPSWMPQSVANGQTSPIKQQSASIDPAAAPSSGDLPIVPWDQPNSGGLSNIQPPKKPKKKLLIGLAGLLIVVGIGAGGVFGYYIPNKPENVYRTGVERSGQAIDQLINNATEQQQLEQIKKSEMNGLLEFSSSEGIYTGTFNVKMDPNLSNGQIDVSVKEKDQPESKFGLKFMTEVLEGKRFPNAYFQMTGLKTLEADSYAPGLTEYEGKWISVESDFLESLGSGFMPPPEDKNKENVSAQEVSQLIRAISDVNNDYVFSADPNKAVLENREYLGKETTEEGIKSFHYKVGINKDHAVAYCKAISERILSEPAAKKIADMDDKDTEEAKKSAIQGCDDSKDDFKEDETFDMWVDTKYKVIHKFRIYNEKDKKDKYTDFGQIYTGGDKLAMFVKYHEDKDNLNIKLTLDVDIKSNSSKAEITGSQDGDDGGSGKASIEAKPYAGELKVEKPAGAISIEEILQKFGFDPTYLSGISAASDMPAQSSGVQQKAQDSDRKTDIMALYGQLEMYYAEHGFYPSLSEINDKAFRAANMQGISDEILMPPGASNPLLATASTASQYGYAAKKCNAAGKQCQDFTISALLSSGEVYSKSSLNN